MYSDVWGTLGATEMDREETLVELVERMEKAVNRLERLVYGDAELGAVGLNERVSKLEGQMADLTQREPVPALWSVGFLLFVLAFGLAIKEARDLVGLAPLPAFGLGALLIGLSMLFFYAGLGWVRKWFR